MPSAEIEPLPLKFSRISGVGVEGVAQRTVLDDAIYLWLYLPFFIEDTKTLANSLLVQCHHQILSILVNSTKFSYDSFFMIVLSTFISCEFFIDLKLIAR